MESPRFSQDLRARLSHFITKNGIGSIVALTEVVPYDLYISVVPSIITLFSNEEEELELIKSFIELEFSNSIQSSVLFRESNCSCLVLSSIFKNKGKRYLQGTLSSNIKKICNCKEAIEIDHNKCKTPVEKSINQLIDHSRKILDKIFKSVDAVPTYELQHFSSFNYSSQKLRSTIWRSILTKFNNSIYSFIRQICIHIKQNILIKFPKEGGAEWQSILASIFFLRFYCPAIFDPTSYRLISSIPSREGRRGLVLVSKVLQSIANNSHFDTEDPSYLPLNQFIESYRPKLLTFIQYLTCLKESELESHSTGKKRKSKNKKIKDHSLSSILGYLQKFSPEIEQQIQQKITRYSSLQWEPKGGAKIEDHSLRKSLSASPKNVMEILEIDIDTEDKDAQLLQRSESNDSDNCNEEINGKKDHGSSGGSSGEDDDDHNVNNTNSVNVIVNLCDVNEKLKLKLDNIEGIQRPVLSKSFSSDYEDDSKYRKTPYSHGATPPIISKKMRKFLSSVSSDQVPEQRFNSLSYYINTLKEFKELRKIMENTEPSASATIPPVVQTDRVDTPHNSSPRSPRVPKLNFSFSLNSSGEHNNNTNSSSSNSSPSTTPTNHKNNNSSNSSGGIGISGNNNMFSVPIIDIPKHEGEEEEKLEELESLLSPRSIKFYGANKQMEKISKKKKDFFRNYSVGHNWSFNHSEVLHTVDTTNNSDHLPHMKKKKNLDSISPSSSDDSISYATATSKEDTQNQEPVIDRLKEIFTPRKRSKSSAQGGSRIEDKDSQEPRERTKFLSLKKVDLAKFRSNSLKIITSDIISEDDHNSSDTNSKSNNGSKNRRYFKKMDSFRSNPNMKSSHKKDEIIQESPVFVRTNSSSKLMKSNDMITHDNFLDFNIENLVSKDSKHSSKKEHLRKVKSSKLHKIGHKNS